MPPGPKPLPVADRLWARVNRTAGPNSCWPWTGYTDRDGYGRIGRGPTKPGGPRPIAYTHQVAYELTHGRRTPGLEIMHTCGTRACCNPAHLVEDTHAANVADGHRAKRHGRLMPFYDDIRAAHAAGETQTSIAQRYGCTQTQVSNIVNHRTLA